MLQIKNQRLTDITRQYHVLEKKRKLGVLKKTARNNLVLELAIAKINMTYEYYITSKNFKNLT